jgi:hypothetical protein
MTNTSSLALLRKALADRRKAKALALRLAEAKASSMESAYGFTASLDFRGKVSDLRDSLARLTPSKE